MSELHKEHPQEYPKGTPPLDPDEARSLADAIPGWHLEDNRLVLESTFKDFQEAFSFVARIALLAEAEGHHPDISIAWNRVKLTFWTHTAEGLTRNDFIMAAKIDRFGSPS